VPRKMDKRGKRKSSRERKALVNDQGFLRYWSWFSERNFLGSHPARHCVPGKPRRACPVLTGWARSFKALYHIVSIHVAQKNTVSRSSARSYTSLTPTSTSILALGGYEWPGAITFPFLGILPCNRGVLILRTLSFLFLTKYCRKKA
jgi:hypothetical protein